MRATQHFHRGLLLGTTRIKRKEIQRNTLKYFWSFGFLQQANKKKKREKLFTWESSQQAKEEREIFLDFLFNTTTKHA